MMEEVGVVVTLMGREGHNWKENEGVLQGEGRWVITVCFVLVT